ncbi:hypothetical protein FK531_19970 [Rhodococcus spelaei]|uniref:ChsH2 C-terminal OB-fold domain-containing protein n=2 Tax=Rhodococcus spelaei TaxID=2546320 RepID=A0A541B0K7_9NOCA|nr:hypothetical protein FK531_19970 [Rhodococcus spelaei]
MRPRTLPPDALLLKRCTNCATLLAPLTATCTSCLGTDLGIAPCSGTGSIVSWKPAPAGTDEPHTTAAPPVNAIVELDDGPRIYTWIEGDIPLRPDRPVRVTFRPTERGERFPVFAVCAAAATGRPALVPAGAA